MPKVLKSFEFSASFKNQKYDLTACEKSPVLFLRGADYHCGDASFVAIVHQRAKRNNFLARTKVVDKGIVVQFFPKEKP